MRAWRSRGRLPLTLILVSLAIAAPVIGSANSFASDASPSPSNSDYPSPPPPLPPQAVVLAAISGLIADPPLYNDPRAPLAIGPLGVRSIEAAAMAADTPVFIAVLPSTIGKPEVVTRQIHKGVGKPGSYVSVVGTRYEAQSTLFPVHDLLTRAFMQERQSGTAGVLTRFIELVGQRAHGTEAVPAPFPWREVLVLGAVALILLGCYSIFVIIRRRGNTQANS